MLRFVKAQFPSSQKYYDYICDIEDIKKDDEVLVMTKYGEKVVTVRGVFFSNLEDMPLPEYAYKKVLAKYIPEADDVPPKDGNTGVGICGTPFLQENRELINYTPQFSDIKRTEKTSTWKDYLFYLFVFSLLAACIWGLLTEDEQTRQFG